VSLAASFLMPKPHHLRVTQAEVVKVPA
jgi:hypothetical protein